MLVLALIVDFLRANGCQVLEAATGEQAVSLIDGEDQQLDVLFTDIRLGGQLNGWDVAEIFRKQRPAMLVLYASGHSIQLALISLREDYRGASNLGLSHCSFEDRGRSAASGSFHEPSKCDGKVTWGYVPTFSRTFSLRGHWLSSHRPQELCMFRTWDR
jgi:CheY-like chemotaxis protein